MIYNEDQKNRSRRGIGRSCGCLRDSGYVNWKKVASKKSCDLIVSEKNF